MIRKRNPTDATLRNIRALKKRLAILAERLGFVEAKAGLTATKMFQTEADIAALQLQFNNLEEAIAARPPSEPPIDQDGKAGWE